MTCDDMTRGGEGLIKYPLFTLGKFKYASRVISNLNIERAYELKTISDPVYAVLL